MRAAFRFRDLSGAAGCRGQAEEGDEARRYERRSGDVLHPEESDPWESGGVGPEDDGEPVVLGERAERLDGGPGRERDLRPFAKGRERSAQALARRLRRFP
jgi:hypothetical protein